MTSTNVADTSRSPQCEPCSVTTYTRRMPDPHYETRKQLFWAVYNQVDNSPTDYTYFRLTPEQFASLTEDNELQQFQRALHDYRVLSITNILHTRRRLTTGEIETAHALKVLMVYDVSDKEHTLMITW